MSHLVRGTLLFIFLTLFSLGSVLAQEWSQQRIRAVAASLHKDLSDPFDKVQLASEIRRYYEWRVRFSPNNYEADMEFQKQFKSYFSRFASTLFTKSLEGADRRLQEQSISQMVKAYSKNRERFAEFYRRMGEANPYYRKMPISQMETIIVQFAIVLNEAGVLIEVLKLTGIFPFC